MKITVDFDTRGGQLNYRGYKVQGKTWRTRNPTNDYNKAIHFAEQQGSVIIDTKVYELEWYLNHGWKLVLN